MGQEVQAMVIPGERWGKGYLSHKRALFPLQAGYCAVTYIMSLKVEKALGFVNVFSNH